MSSYFGKFTRSFLVASENKCLTGTLAVLRVLSHPLSVDVVFVVVILIFLVVIVVSITVVGVIVIVIIMIVVSIITVHVLVWMTLTSSLTEEFK